MASPLPLFHLGAKRLLGVAFALVASASTPAWAAQPAQSAQTRLIAQGKYLAIAGGCQGCHTAANGQAFAGGLSMNTPFGAISTPNITPDKATGIGDWTDAQFYAAMHDGLGRHGEYLYPVMPFPWFTKVSREDVMAIKAYLFSLPAVRKPREPSHLAFPFSVRESLAVWRGVVFSAASFKPDPAQSAQVNRGSYLVNGLGHCGECHNSRLLAGTSKLQKTLQGGAIDGWYAPNITSDVKDGIGAWSDAELVQFLKTGAAPGKGVAVGSMLETVHTLHQLNDTDLAAIAAYLKSTKPESSVDHAQTVDTSPHSAGATVYLDRCASCHGLTGQGLAGVVPALAGNGAVQAQGPENVVGVVLGGLEARQNYAPMLAVGAGMADADVAAVVNYVRQSWGNHAPATASAPMVADLRAKTDGLMTGARQQGCPDLGQTPLARAIADPAQGIGSRLGDTTESNMPQQVAQVVSKVKTAAPKATKAEVVNGLTGAYCRVVRSDAKLDWNARALQLGHFSELVYMQLSSNGLAPKAR